MHHLRLSPKVSSVDSVELTPDVHSGQNHDPSSETIDGSWAWTKGPHGPDKLHKKPTRIVNWVGIEACVSHDVIDAGRPLRVSGEHRFFLILHFP